MWDVVASTVAEEFSDVPDWANVTRIALRLLLAAALGGVLGYERERRGKAAGVRTHMLVALGTALFVLVPQQAGMSAEAVSRVIQGLLAGIGFLGAGAVLKQADSGHVRGLTTAAGIWSTAAIGVAIGLGREATAIVSTALVLLVLGLLLRWENRAGIRERPRQDEAGS